MSERTAGSRLPPLPRLVAPAMVALGIGLTMFGAPPLLAIAGLGAFGPGILRELGLLHDQDEFQRETSRRAGYHAYLAGGLATVLVVSALRWPALHLEPSSEWVVLILLVLWTTWLFSALLAYWGPRTTASRVLLTFGCFWAVFVLADLVSESDFAGAPLQSLLGVLVGIGVVAPFFALAWAAHRRPRPTALALLGIAAIFFVVFALPAGGLPVATRLVTAVLLIAPVLGSGLALLADAREDDDTEG